MGRPASRCRGSTLPRRPALGASKRRLFIVYARRPVDCQAGAPRFTGQVRCPTRSRGAGSGAVSSWLRLSRAVPWRSRTRARQLRVITFACGPSATGLWPPCTHSSCRCPTPPVLSIGARWVYDGSKPQLWNHRANFRVNMHDVSSRPVCPHASSCSLFPRFAMRASLGVWAALYCESKFESCARYQAANERVAIPDLLLPNGKVLRVAGGEK